MSRSSRSNQSSVAVAEDIVTTSEPTVDDITTSEPTVTMEAIVEALSEERSDLIAANEIALADPVVTLPDGRTVDAVDVPDPDPIIVSAVDAFKVAVDAAYEAAAPGTGTIPAMYVDAVKVAFRAMKKSERDSVAAIVPTMLSAAMTDPKGPDMRIVGASANLSMALAEATAAPVKSERLVTAPADLIGAAVERAVARTILARARLSADVAADLGTISDPTERLAAEALVDAILDGSYPVADWTPFAVNLGKRRVSSGTTSTRAPRDPSAPRTDVAGTLAAYLADHPTAAKYGALKAATGLSSAGAITNAIVNGKVAGWTEGVVDGAKGAVPVV